MMHPFKKRDKFRTKLTANVQKDQNRVLMQQLGMFKKKNVYNESLIHVEHCQHFLALMPFCT